MKKFKRILLLACMLAAAASYAQKEELTLSFTGRNLDEYVVLDSIQVYNMSEIVPKSTSITLYWPDTVLSLQYVLGTDEYPATGAPFRLFQNAPNPVYENTRIKLHIPENGTVSTSVTDLHGRLHAVVERSLPAGMHEFRFTPGGQGMYIVNVLFKGEQQSIKVISACKDCTGPELKHFSYTGEEFVHDSYKDQGAKSDTTLTYNFGDIIAVIGYATWQLESGMYIIPEGDTTVRIQFSSNVPCPGIETVDYGGIEYNTVMIFNQCWFQENLNYGTRIEGSVHMTENGVVEKYCYDDDEANCTLYGGLYQWDELMEYTETVGARGICPDGWHIPSDLDFCELEGNADDSHTVAYPDYISAPGPRGFNQGYRLKSTDLWESGEQGTDTYGFRVYPTGKRFYEGVYGGLFNDAIFWTSNPFSDDALNREFYGSRMDVWKMDTPRELGYSVRCIKD